MQTNTYVPATCTTHYHFIHYQCKTLNTKDAKLNNRKSRIIKHKYLNRYTVVCQIDNMEITHISRCIKPLGSMS